MKRILCILLILVLALSVVGCFKKEFVTVNDSKKQEDDSSKTNGSDLSYILNKGGLVVGMTDYAPMNYKDDNGNWTGFDTEFAQAVGKKLGVDIEFVEIDWDYKWATLNSKKIDVVWNGMTLNQEAKTNADCTNPYVINAQVVVMKADRVANYKDVESMKALNFAVEAGSAGKDIAAEKKLNYTEYAAQSDALTAVKSGKADGCIIDITMAKTTTGAGTAFSDLGIGISLFEEEYAIACRKGSDLTAKINHYIQQMKSDGTLQTLADKYGLTLAS